MLAELADFSHAQIGEVIGVRTHKVKALIHQARTTLIAERDAREQPCDEVREELATARGGALRRGPLRRHLRQCAPCRAYRDAVAEQRRALALALPVAPSLGLKAAVLGAASAGSGAAAGGVSLGGGLAAKVLTSALVVGTAAGGGAAIVREVEPAPAPARKVVVHHTPAAAPAPTRTAPRAVARDPGGSGSAPPRRAPRRWEPRSFEGAPQARRGSVLAARPEPSRGRARSRARPAGQGAEAAREHALGPGAREEAAPAEAGEAA